MQILLFPASSTICNSLAKRRSDISSFLVAPVNKSAPTSKVAENEIICIDLYLRSSTFSRSEIDLLSKFMVFFIVFGLFEIWQF